jgi:group I intron endonuclease
MIKTKNYLVYKTTCILNNKYYIGKDSNNNPNYIGSGIALINAIKKYGKENFIKEILEKCNSIDQLNKREKFWIKKLKSQDKSIGYNIADGGNGGDLFTNNPNKEKTRKKLSEIAFKRNSNPIFQRKIRIICRSLKNRKKVSIGVRKRYRDKVYYKKWYTSMLAKPRIEKLRIAASGINNSRWKGNVYVYNSSGKLESICGSMLKASKDLNLSGEYIRMLALNHDFVKTGQYRGYRFIVSKKKQPKRIK